MPPSLTTERLLPLTWWKNQLLQAVLRPPHIHPGVQIHDTVTKTTTQFQIKMGTNFSSVGGAGKTGLPLH